MDFSMHNRNGLRAKRAFTKKPIKLKPVVCKFRALRNMVIKPSQLCEIVQSIFFLLAGAEIVNNKGCDWVSQ